MKKKVLDCRGLACPKPVLETKDALESLPTDRDMTLEVIVDNEAAKANVSRFAESQGCDVEVREEADGEFKLFITRGKHYKKAKVTISCDTTPAPIRPQGSETRTAIVFKSDIMGSGHEDLGEKLMDAFCHTLLELKPHPWYLIFYNRGIRLATSDSIVLDALKEFEKHGCTILVCGTCLRHYGLEDELSVGRVSNMFEILEALQRVDKIITP